MQPACSFWPDFNFMLSGYFNQEMSYAFAPQGREEPLLLAKIAAAAGNGIYAAYESHYTLRGLDLVVQEDIIVANFVHQQLLEMTEQFLPGDEALPIVREAITIEEPEEHKYVIKIAFEALIFFVRGSQVKKPFHNIEIYEPGGPNIYRELIPGVLSFTYGHLKVASVFSRLQVGNEAGKTNIFEIDITSRACALFGGGKINRNLSDDLDVDPALSTYMSKTRITSQQLFLELQARDEAPAITDTMDEAEEVEEADADERRGAAEARRRARGGVWIASAPASSAGFRSSSKMRAQRRSPGARSARLPYSLPRDPRRMAGAASKDDVAGHRGLDQK